MSAIMIGFQHFQTLSNRNVIIEIIFVTKIINVIFYLTIVKLSFLNMHTFKTSKICLNYKAYIMVIL